MNEASFGQMLRIRKVSAYLGLSHQRGTQMYAEGKLPESRRDEEDDQQAPDTKVIPAPPGNMPVLAQGHLRCHDYEMHGGRGHGRPTKE